MSKYLIIGGVAGGASTAARLRRLDENAEIVIFERGKYISYANCGLPYYVGETIKEREQLFVQTPETFGKRFKVDVRVENEVLSIDAETKKVSVKNLSTGETYEETYDKLILSPGAEPVRPPIPGINSKNIFTLRNVPDTDKIKKYVDEMKPKRAIIVGAGFIGLEMAENLHQRGVFVTIVEMAEQVMTVLDSEMAAEVHQHLKMKNVEFYLKDGVAAFEEDENGLLIKLQSGRQLEADMVILSIGVRPEIKLAKSANLKIGDKNGILVNEYMQTSNPDIYAVGDAIEFPNPIIKKSMLAYLAGPANKQGRIAADNIVRGNKRKYKGSILTAIAKVFDLTVASTGVSEKTLKTENISYVSSITHSASHAGYYPGAIPMSIKIVFSPDTGKLFGAQIVGYEGVDKRIEMFAAVLNYGGTIFDLQELDHAYAPPYSSAKDPVNIAGFVAENILDGTMKIIHWHEVLKMDSREFVLVDVRSPLEVESGTIDGAINIPVDSTRDMLDRFPKDKKIILFCGVGLRAYISYRILAQLGYDNIFNLSGGYKTYAFITQKQGNEDIFASDCIQKNDCIYQVKAGDCNKS